jgi:hypothetical protein
MKLRSITLALLANAATYSPASAQARILEIRPDWIWIQHADGSIVGYNTIFVFGLILVVLVAIAGLCCAIDASSGSSSATYYTTTVVSALEAAEQHEQEAARLRALKRQTDAHTELTASLINKARTDAEYSELSQITDHDRTVRGLKREL